MFNHLEQREVFHLLFLKSLMAKLKAGTWAVKGGVNLRMFFGSPRYSEDIDLDVKNIDIFRLREVVMNILLSSSFRSTLKIFGIDSLTPPEMKSAKQTETTQRFKVHLHTATGENLFTKLEFSRRSFDDSALFEAVSSNVLYKYKMPPLIVAHYPAHTAIIQKIRALAGRTTTQARDVFDIFILMTQIEKKQLSVDNVDLAVAHSNAFALDFRVFMDTVVSYLSEEDQKIYAIREVWDEMRLKVADFIEGLKQ